MELNELKPGEEARLRPYWSSKEKAAPLGWGRISVPLVIGLFGFAVMTLLALAHRRHAAGLVCFALGLLFLIVMLRIFYSLTRRGFALWLQGKSRADVDLLLRR